MSAVLSCYIGIEKFGKAEIKGAIGREEICETECNTKSCDWMIDGKCHNPSKYADNPATCIYNTTEGRTEAN